MSSTTRSRGAGEWTRYLLGFIGAPDPSLVRSYGGRINRVFTLVDAVAAVMREADAHAASCHPRVSYVEEDGTVRMLPGERLVSWGVDRVFGRQRHPFPTWRTTRGEGMQVAIVDTGIDPEHRCLKVVGGFNTLLAADPLDFRDDQGHGTLVAGIVAGMDDRTCVFGAAPDASLYAVKALDGRGAGTVVSLVAALELAARSGIAIINMSLGTATDYRTLRHACAAAHARGHVLIAAAGNSGNPEVSATMSCIPPATPP